MTSPILVAGTPAHALETDMFRDLLTEPRLFVFLTAPWHAERSACMPSSAWQPKPTNPTVGRAQV
jgi:hypothetical protein